MFWSTEKTSGFWTSETSGTPAAPREGRGPVSERLREQLHDRLLVALDFATLGAYELTAPEGDAELAAAHAAPEAPHTGEHRRERTKRVLLFAKAVPTCPEHGGSGRPPCDPVADTSLRGAQRRRGWRRRAGMARAAEQPCTWD
jgi:hypothetical protein